MTAIVASIRRVGSIGASPQAKPASQPASRSLFYTSSLPFLFFCVFSIWFADIPRQVSRVARFCSATLGRTAIAGCRRKGGSTTALYGRECRGFRMAPAERAVLDGEMTAADELQPRLHGHDSEAAQDPGCTAGVRNNLTQEGEQSEGDGTAKCPRTGQCACGSKPACARPHWGERR